MDSEMTMRDELSAILADPKFVRSPVLSRLLEFLVETTIGGQGKGLKSYSVAVEGLGREGDFDAQGDTYPRVQVARLRRAMDAFYTSAGADRSHRLWIGSGSYEVTLIPNALSDPAQGRAGLILSNLRGLRSARRAAPAGIVVILILAIVMFVQFRSQAAVDRWRTANTPIVDVEMRDDTQGKLPPGMAEVIRRTLLTKISRYEGLRASFDPAEKANYTVHISIVNENGDFRIDLMLEDRLVGRILMSENSDLKFGGNPNEIEKNSFISNSAFIISHATGAIHSNERRRNFKTDTPYGCWLRFSAMLQNNHVVGDRSLINCAKDWYSAAPNHPLSAALYSWTLIDSSIVQPTEARRKELIDEATETVDSAKMLNPNSVFLQAAAMRVYGFSGDGEAMQMAANRALQLNPENLDVQGLVGTMLVLRNDLRGEAMVKGAIARHFNPPPWYFIGLFVSAMMREDTVTAGQALTQLRNLNHSAGYLPILSAAYEARTGQVAKARVSWEKAKQYQPILRVDPELLFVRLPMAPEVRARLRKWLAPVLV